MTLDISDIVRVTAQIAPQGVLRREFGIPLFLTTDTTLPAGSGRVGVYPNFEAIEAAFPVGSEPYQAGQIYFSQTPFPKNLVIARWIDADAPAILQGGMNNGTVVGYQGVPNGSFSINGNNITGINLGGVLSFTEVATRIETALQASGIADYAAATFTFDPLSQSFTLSTDTVVGSTVGMTVATPAGVGTDISALLGLDALSGAVANAGDDAELVEDALESIRALNDQWYFITVDNSISDTPVVQDISAWAEAGIYQFSSGTTDPQVIVTGDTISIAAQLDALERERTFTTYSKTADYKALSVAGRFSSVNFNANNSIITAKFKDLPGTLADDDIDTTIQTELERKRINYYAPFTGDTIYAEGYNHKPGVFTDVRYWLDWYVNAIQVDVYNLLRQSPARVPLTNAGITAVRQVMELVSEQGVRNGGIAPGQLSTALQEDVQNTTLNQGFDGYLPKGYLIHIGALADLPQDQRNQRIAPPVKIWLKGSGAIHFIDIDICFEN